MPSFVIDASLAASWCFPDERTTYTNGILQVVARYQEATAPRLWTYEIRNSVLIGMRRHRLTRDDALSFLKSVDALHIRLLDPPTYEPIFLLAERYGLTFYDASYLELALRKGLPLASLDKELCAAAEQAHIPLFSP